MNLKFFCSFFNMTDLPPFLYHMIFSTWIFHYPPTAFQYIFRSSIKDFSSSKLLFSSSNFILSTSLPYCHVIENPFSNYHCQSLLEQLKDIFQLENFYLLSFLSLPELLNWKWIIKSFSWVNIIELDVGGRKLI